MERYSIQATAAAWLAAHEELACWAKDRIAWLRNLAGRGAGRILETSCLIEAFVTAKDTVRALLDRLPNDCSLDDVLYHLYVVQAVSRGLSDGETGRVISHEQVAADLRRKWLLGSAK